jgi:hypothetical protein
LGGMGDVAKWASRIGEGNPRRAFCEELKKDGRMIVGRTGKGRWVLLELWGRDTPCSKMGACLCLGDCSVVRGTRLGARDRLWGDRDDLLPTQQSQRVRIRTVHVRLVLR